MWYHVNTGAAEVVGVVPMVDGDVGWNRSLGRHGKSQKLGLGRVRHEEDGDNS